MDTIKLKYLPTGEVFDCELFLSNTPQYIMIGTDGVATGYSSLADIAKHWEIVPNENLKKGEK